MKNRNALFALTLAALAGTTQADTLHWTGAIDGNWKNGGNWQEGRYPNSTDFAIIPAGFGPSITPGQFCQAGTLYVQPGGSVIVLGQLYVYGGASIQGNMSIAGQTGIFIHRDDVNLEGVITMWDGGSIGRYYTGSGVFTVQSNGKITIPAYDTKGVRIGTSMSVKGIIDDKSTHDLTIGTAASDQTPINDYIAIQVGGQMNLSAGGGIVRSSYPGQGFAYLANDGQINVSGTQGMICNISSDIGLFSSGTVIVDAVTFQPHYLALLNANAELTAGSFFIRNGGILNTSSQALRWLKPGTLVQIQGAGSTWIGLGELGVNQGVISVWDGGALVVAPSGGVFDNFGYVEVGINCYVDIAGGNGQFRNESSATLDMYVNGYSTNERSRVIADSLFLGGTLIARIDPSLHIVPNSAIAMLAYTSWSFGQFDTFLPFGPDPLFLSYDPNAVDLKGKCVSDIDADGNVDLNDFFAFFNAFDISDAPADLDGNPGVDLGDFFAFFNHWDLGC